MTFRTWFRCKLKACAPDIASHGADQGHPHISYTADCVRIFDRFASEIWEMAVCDTEQLGQPNVAAMIAGFRRDDMLVTIDGFKTLMVWYACEKLARQLVEREPTLFEHPSRRPGQPDA